MESTTYWNNDGIDLTDCVNARVINCVINAADDAICLKSDDRNSRCENIYIADCRLRSSANAVKLGTASHGGFKNITIRSIDVYDTYRSAIAIEAVDGGVIEQIDVRDIRAVNTGNAFLSVWATAIKTVYTVKYPAFIFPVCGWKYQPANRIRAIAPKGRC